MRVLVHNPQEPEAKEVQVGWHFTGTRRVPVFWPTGYYHVVATGDVGGRYNGYYYVVYQHEASGFRDNLKGHQIDALEVLGVLTYATVQAA